MLCGNSEYGTLNAGSPPPVKIVQCGSVAFIEEKSLALSLMGPSWLARRCGAIRGPKPDLVVTLTTPPLISLLGTLVKRLRGSRHFIWEMDVYPDIAVDLNVLRPRSHRNATDWHSGGLLPEES